MKLPLFIGALSFILALSATDGFAQHTVFNVPSAEVAGYGTASLEFTSSFRHWTPKYASFLPRVTAGVGRNIELTTGVLDTEGSPFGDSTALTVGAKWRPWSSEQTGTAVTASSTALVPFRGNAAKGSVISFAGIHQTLPRLGARLSGGAYDATPHGLKAGNVVGGWLSFEQPLYRGLRLMGDWMSGDHRLGVLTSGLGWSNHRHSVQFGYQISNQAGRLNGLTGKYGFYF